MERFQPHPQNGLRSGLLYGVGFLAAFAVTGLLFNLIDLTLKTPTWRPSS
jgi:hypothetical protein